MFNWIRRLLHRKTQPLTGGRRSQRSGDRVPLCLEHLEDRVVPSGTTYKPFYVLAQPGQGPQPDAFPYTANTGGYAPKGIQTAYGLSSLYTAGITGAGETIAVVDYYDDPNIASDLATFDTTFSLAAPPSFTKVNQNGGSTTGLPQGGGWDGEESLDVEWAHAIAPGAKIILVECNPSVSNSLNTGADWAAKSIALGGGGANVVSMSFGTSGGYASETSEDSVFSPVTYPNVTFLASTDDNGSNGGPSPQAAYPSDSPNVVAVGGTFINLNADNGNYNSESVWGDPPSNGATGGGVSNYEAQPSYQNTPTVNAFSTTHRSAPDVSFDADPNSGVAVLDTYGGGGWGVIGGTSLSSPCWGGLVALADQIRANAGLSSLTGRTQTLPQLYAMYENAATYASDFHDITSGNNHYPGASGQYSAGVGYDLATGIGTPIASNMDPDLANVTSLNYTAPAGTNNFVLKEVGTNLDLFDNGSATPAVFGTASRITQVTITGGTDNSLTCDYSNGVFTAAVSFTGGAGAGTHTLQFQGNAAAFATETSTPSGPQAGTVAFPSQTITYTNVTVINDLASVTNLTVKGFAAADQINILNSATANETKVTSTNAKFAPFNFLNAPTVTVTETTSTDTFVVNNPAPATGMTTLDVISGAAVGSTFDILTTPGTVTTNITGAGTSTIVAVGNASSVQGILGPLSIGNSSGQHNAITVDDSADTTARTFTIAAGTMVGLEPGAITYTAGGTQSITINGGSGGNTITVNSATANLTTIVNTGNGNDGVTVNPIPTLGTGTFTINGQLPTPPTAGNTLFYTGAGTYTPTGVGSGNITQTGDGTINFTGFASISVGASTANSHVLPIGPPNPVQSGNTVTVQMQTETAAGANLTTGGLTVLFGLVGGAGSGTFGPVSYVGGGLYQATFTGVLAGSNTVTATINGAPLTSVAQPIAVTPGPYLASASTLSVNSLTDPSGTGDTITLTLRDAAGNAVTSGYGSVSIVFSAAGGTSTGTFAPPPAIDGGTGVFTSTFTGILAGSPTTISATLNGGSIPSTTSIQVTPGVFNLATSTVSVGTASVASNTTTTVTLTALDTAGNANPTGITAAGFSLSTGAGVSTGTLSGFTNVGNGVYSETFTGVLVGTPLTVSASLNGSAVTSTPLPTITVTPGAFSLTQSLVSAGTTSVVSNTTTTVTLTTYDAAGNANPTGITAAGFSLSTGAGVSTGTLSGFTNVGNGVYSETFTGVLVGTPLTVSASLNGSAVTSTPLPTITVTPGAFSLTQSLVSVGTTSVASNTTTTVTLTALDAAGNANPTGITAAGFSLSTGAGVSTGTLSGFTNVGNGVYSETFTGVLVGTPLTVSASLNGSAVTSTPLPTITVTPGAFSLTQSLVSVASSSVASNTTTTVTLTAFDAAGNANPIGITSEGFSLSTGAGVSTGTLSGFTNVGNGVYTETFTGVLVGTPLTVSASLNGSAVTSTPLPTITVTPGAFDAAQSTVSVGSSSVVSGTTTTVTLTALDINGNANPTGVSLGNVAFTATGGTSTGTLSGLTNAGNGVFTETFTGVLAGPPPTTIGATVGGVAVTSTLPTILVTPGAIDDAHSTITVASATDPSGVGDLITLTLRDLNGNQLANGSGASVAFSTTGGASVGTIGPVTNNNDGTFSATFTGALVGTVTIHATINANNVTSPLPTITVTAGPFSLTQSLVSVASSSVASNTTTTVTLTAFDALGNPNPSGIITLGFNLSAGAGLSTGTLSGFTNVGNGVYTETFTGGFVGAPVTVNAKINGSAVTSPLPSITVTPGTFDSLQSLVSVASNSVVSGTTTTVKLTARDFNGNANPTGVSLGNVAFTATGGTSTGTLSGLTNVGNGVFTDTFTGVLAGLTPTTIGATVGGIAVTSPLPQILVTPAGLDDAHSTITVASSLDASGVGDLITLTLRDLNGNQLANGSGASVTFSTTGSASVGTIGQVTNNNNGTFSATFTGNLVGTVTINATINANNVTSTPLPTITVTPGAFSRTQSLVNVGSSSVASNATTTVMLTALDAAGNANPTGIITEGFNLSTGAGLSTGTLSGLTNLGNGVYTETFTGVHVGTPLTVNAKINGSAVTSTPLPTITVTPGVFDAAQSTVSVGSGSVVSGTTTTVTLTARDSNGNANPTGVSLGNVAFSATGGASTGTLSGLTNVGNGVFTDTFTGVLAGLTPTTIGATVGGTAVTSTLPTILVTPGSLDDAQSTLTVASATDASGIGDLITLTLRDLNGNQLPNGSGASVAFSTSGGAGVGTIGLANNNNDGTFSATFTGNLIGTVTIDATINANNVTSTPLPTIQVTPGVFSLATSTVSVASASVASNTTTTVTLTAFDAVGNANPTGITTEGFSLSAGAGLSTGTLSSFTVVGNGVYTEAFTGVHVGTPLTVSANINGSTVTSTPLPTITVTPGAFDAAQSTVSVGSSSVVSGTTTTVTLTARDFNGNANPTGVSLGNVAFSATGGTSTGTLSGLTSVGNGVFTDTFTGMLAGLTPTTIGATVGGTAVTSTLPTILVTPGGIDDAHSTITVASSTDASGVGDLITLTLRDLNGNQLPNGSGASVAFSTSGGAGVGTIGPVTNNNNGTFSATFTGALVGSVTIAATINANNVTSTPLPTITVTPGAFSLTQSLVDVGTASVASNTTTTVTLTALDAVGNANPTGITTEGFSLSAGAGVSSGTLSGLTNVGNGVYTETFTGVLVGTPLTVTANINGSAVTPATSPTITVTPGAFDGGQSTVSVASSSVVSGTTTTVTLTARDFNGNANPTGVSLGNVAFNATGGASTGTLSGLTNAGNGVYTDTFTGVLAGLTPTTIGATVGGTAVTSSLPTILVTPGGIDDAHSTITVASSSDASGVGDLITLTLRDLNGNQLANGSGATVTFSTSGGAAIGTIGPVNNNNDGTFSATFTGGLIGTVTIDATINANNVTSTPLPTITVTPGAFSLTQSLVSVGTASVASNTTTTVTLTALDDAGNANPTGITAASFSLSTGPGLSTGTLSGFTNVGNGVYTETFTGVHVGLTPLTVSANINGSAVTSPLPSITVTPGAFDATQSTVSVGSGSVVSGTTTTVTLTARDINGNANPTGVSLGNVAFSATGGTSTGTLSGLTSVGNGVFTETFTGVLAGLTPTTIGATVGGTAVTSPLPTILVTPGAIDDAQSTLTVASSSDASGTGDLITLTLRDLNGNQLPNGSGASVTIWASGASGGAISLATDNNDGTFSATFTGGGVGTVTIYAIINGNNVTSTPVPTITVTPGAFSLAQSQVSVASSSVVSNTTTTVTLTALDAAGNANPTGITAAGFSLSTGPGLSTGTLSGFTNVGNGVYSETFTGVRVGSVFGPTPLTVHASINGLAVTSTLPTIAVTPGAFDAAQSTVAVGSSSVVSGTTTSVALTAFDSNGNANPTGVSLGNLAFTATGGTSTGTFSGLMNVGLGFYTATFTGVLPGLTPTTIGATVGGVAVTSPLPTILVTPGAIDDAHSTITVASSSDVSGTGDLITLTLRDLNGNQLANGSGATVAFSTIGGAAVGTIGPVTNNNNGTFSATFTGGLIGTVTIDAIINGNTVTSTPLPTITVTPGAFSRTQSLVSVASASVAANTTTTVTLTALDAAGNANPTGITAAGFSLSTGAGLSTGTLSGFTSAGNGVYTETFTGVRAGKPLTVTANINGSNVAVQPTIAVTLVVPGSAANLAANATQISIAGFGFDPTAANDKVTFNDGAVGSVTTASATSLKVTFSTRPTSAGSLTATVTTDNVSSGTVLVATVTPVVTSSAANLAANATQMSIAGFGFDPTAANNTITFNDGAVGTVSAASANSLTVTFSTNPTIAGSLTATVTTDGQSSNTVPVAAVTPVVTSSNANPANAAQIILSGFGFDPTVANDSVTFNNGAVGIISAASPNSLTVTFSTYPTTTSNLTVVVTTDGQSSNTVPVAAVTPVVTSSNANLAANATQLSIAGFGFDPNAANDRVTFNDGAIGSVAAASPTLLVVTFSNRPTSAGSLTATVTIDNVSSGAAVQVATVTPVVTLNTANLAANATQISIAGSGFDLTPANNIVVFNDGAVGNVTQASATTLLVTLTSPPTSAGSLTAVVTTDNVSSGTPVPVATVTPAALTNNIFLLQRNGSSLQLFENNLLVDQQPLASVTNYVIPSAGSSSSLIVNLRNGYFAVGGAIYFQGGNASGNGLAVVGGQFNTSNVIYHGADAGSLSFTGASGTSPLFIAYTGTGSLDLSGNSTATLNFQLPAGNDVVPLADHGNGATSGIASYSGSFPSTTFQDPTTLLQLSAGGGGADIGLVRTAATSAVYALDGGAGQNSLHVDFSALNQPDTDFLTATAISSAQLGSPIYYKATGGNFATGVVLSLGNAGNQVNIQGTQAGAPTLVQTGNGNDNILVCSSPVATQGNLSGLASPLDVDAQGGTNQLALSDETQTVGAQYYVTSNAIANAANLSFVVFYQATGGNFAGGINLVASRADDTIIVLSQLAGTPTTIDSFFGNDTINVIVTNTSAYTGLALNLGIGANTLLLFDESGGATFRQNTTGFDSGVIGVSYLKGSPSTIAYGQIAQVFANDGIQAG